jgi:hypothetical protein
MRGTLWSAVALSALLASGCNDDEPSGDTDGGCVGYGEDPDPCCCFPEPGVVACNEQQLCPTITADCGDGTLGMGACTLDQASDAAVTCALTALGDPASSGSLLWTIRELGGAKRSDGSLHLGGTRAALETTIDEGMGVTEQSHVGSVPAGFDPETCAMWPTAGERFECMLNATALEGGLTCHDATVVPTSGGE